MVKIQYCSDLHLEFKPITQIPKLVKNVGADILVLAGDISAIDSTRDYDKFVALITYYSKKYKYIIHISGNHEMYCTTKQVRKEHCVDEVHKKFKALMKLITNYIYLNCDIVTLTINNKPYMFAGATLWTKINPTDAEYVQKSMNDYSSIYLYDNALDKIEKYTVEHMQKAHSKHVAFFKRAIKKATEAKLPLVIITHHKPIFEGSTTNRLKQAYEVDMSKILKRPVVLAIHGHTHEHYDKTINGIRYVSNPKGYPSQHCNYKDDIYVSI